MSLLTTRLIPPYPFSLGSLSMRGYSLYIFWLGDGRDLGLGPRTPGLPRCSARVEGHTGLDLCCIKGPQAGVYIYTGQ